MADKLFSEDPVKVGDSKRPIVIIITVVVLISLQFIGHAVFQHAKVKHKATLIEDPNRTVYKEEDIARGLKNFGVEAKESFFSKLKARERNALGRTEGSKPERLSPISIIRHEEAKPTEEKTASALQSTVLGLPLGTKIPAILKDKIFSFNVENQVEAEVTKDVYYLGKLRLAKGTKFFGTVSILHSDNRVNIHFSRVLLPSGEDRRARAVAHSLDGSGGIKGKVHRYWGKRFFTLTGKTLLGAMTLLTVPNRQDALSLDSQLRLNATSNLSQEGARELDSVKVDKSISVESTIPILIVLLESL